MAGVKPRAPGADLLPKARFAPPLNRFPVKLPAASRPPADQVLGKYR
jgi:hypothetical protein